MKVWQKFSRSWEAGLREGWKEGETVGKEHGVKSRGRGGAGQEEIRKKGGVENEGGE